MNLRPSYFIAVLVFLFTSPLAGQEYAEFSTDTDRVKNQWDDIELKYSEQIADQFWIIDGKKLRYGNETIRVKVNPNKLDTIYFKAYRRNMLDTIICNISTATKYKFHFNECCGAFNVSNESENKFITGSILYSLTTSDSSKKYLGTLGEAGIMINENQRDTLTVNCRSAMSPNIYNLSLNEIEVCNSEKDCPNGVCLVEKGKEDPNWDFGYTMVSSKMEMLYMPLSSEPIKINYDPLKKQIKMDGILLREF